MYEMNPVRPDFAVVGVPHGDQVMLIASRSIFSGELRHETDFEEVYNAWYVAKIPTSQRFEIELGMSRYELIIADTYADAFRKLFENWSADDYRTRPRAQTKIEGRRAIDGPEGYRSLEP